MSESNVAKKVTEVVKMVDNLIQGIRKDLEKLSKVVDDLKGEEKKDEESK